MGGISSPERLALGHDPAPVAVTRWTARLVDSVCEQDYLASRLAEDRRRLKFVLVFVALTVSLNLAGDLYALHSGVDLGWGWIPYVGVLVAIPVFALLLTQVGTPRSLEVLAVALALTAIAATLALLMLHPRLGAVWTTMMIGALIIIYFCIPARFAILVALAVGYTLVAPLTWSLSVAPAPTPDDMFRTILRLLLANILGFTVANALQRSQRVQFAQNRLLQTLLATDSLTGIFNRRHFDAALADEWRRCARARAPLSLLMIDVDHFKPFNDAYGHQRGDACLRHVATLLRQGARRPGDLVARYGGEEFTCLLSNTDTSGALAVAERLRAIIDQARISHPASPIGPILTISIGVATAYPPAESPQALVGLADRLLYAAKQSGRNGFASATVGAGGQTVPPDGAGGGRTAACGVMANSGRRRFC